MPGHQDSGDSREPVLAPSAAGLCSQAFPTPLAPLSFWFRCLSMESCTQCPRGTAPGPCITQRHALPASGTGHITPYLPLVGILHLLPRGLGLPETDDRSDPVSITQRGYRRYSRQPFPPSRLRKKRKQRLVDRLQRHLVTRMQ